jgi:ribosomal protein S18 acetylase RimI-like enzyme
VSAVSVRQTPPVQIRPATDADLGLVATMRLAFLADHRGVRATDFESLFIERTHRFVADRHRAGDLLTWFADDGDRSVGVVSMLMRSVPPRPDAFATVEGYLLNLYVVPERRRQGIGQQLLDAGLGHAAANGYRRLVLHATDDGRAMYETAGFVRNDRWYELDLGS